MWLPPILGWTVPPWERYAEGLILSISECHLILKSGHYRCSWLRWGHTGVGRPLLQYASRKMAVWRRGHASRHVVMEADWSYAAVIERTPKMASDRQRLERGREGPLQLSERAWPCWHLAFILLDPRLWNNQCPLVQQPQETNTRSLPIKCVILLPLVIE